LIALLLPAVQQAREAARRSQCKNNLKQIGLGLHNYHDTHNIFPYGYWSLEGTVGIRKNRAGWFQRLLPFVEQAALYQAYEESNPEYAHQATNQMRIVIKTFVCPSNPSFPVNSLGFRGNYGGNAGSTVGAARSTTGNGILYNRSKTRMKDVVDGLSNTVLVGEGVARTVGGGSGNAYTPWSEVGAYWGGGIHGGGAICTAEPPNTPVADCGRGCGNYDEALFPCRSTDAATPAGFTCSTMVTYVRSHHTGGAHLVLGDGSVRFVSNNIHLNTFRALGTRNSGDLIGAW